MSEHLAVVSSDAKLPSQVEEGDLLRYLLAIERANRVRAELALVERAQVDASAAIKSKYALSDKDTINGDGKITRA